MSYNLLEENWIPVLYADGRFERVGIRQALAKAGRIRQIAASNPMDNVALLRFLLAVLLWCKGDAKTAVMALSDRSMGVPEDWLAKLNEHKTAFNLLGDGQRFFQDTSAPSKKRPIGDLLVEFPTETKIAHLRHVRDNEYGLCTACCATGIVRFCAFANYAGKGYTSGVNGPAPAYAIMHGSTLLQTLRLKWPPDAKLHRQPPWLCATAPSEADLDAVTVFAWRSRRLWLNDPSDEDNCASCSERTGLIRELRNSGGWNAPFQTTGQAKKYWDQDPHLILVEKRSTEDDEPDASDSDDDAPLQSRRGSAASTTTTLAFPRPGRHVMAHVGFWRRATISLRGNRSDAIRVVVAGPASTQTGMLYQDATALHFSPLADDAAAAIEFVSKALESLGGALRSSTPNPQRQHPERKAALDALSPSLEARLRCELKDCQQPQGLKKRLQPVVQDVVSVTTPGSPLRRREAMQRAQRALNAALREIVSNQTDGSTADYQRKTKEAKATKPKRDRKKKEDGT
jgi:hypothetical protein